MQEEHSPTPNTAVPNNVASTQAVAWSNPDAPQKTADNGSVYGLSTTNFRSLLVKLFLTCLVTGAVVAVVGVLMGSMTDVVWRAVVTVFVAMVHILIMFGVVSMSSSPEHGSLQRSTNIVVNITVTLVILGFFTAIGNIWEIVPGDLAGKLYATYVILFISVIHGKIVMDAGVYDTVIRRAAYGNDVFIALVAGLMLGVVYVHKPLELLNGFYGRLLAAAVIVDVTCSMIIAVLLKLHTQKHPELYQDSRTVHVAAGRILVLLLLIVVLGWPLISILMFSLAQNARL